MLLDAWVFQRIYNLAVLEEITEIIAAPKVCVARVIVGLWSRQIVDCMVFGQSPCTGVNEVIMDGLKILNVQRVLIVPRHVRGCMRVLVIGALLTFSGRQIFFIDKTRVPISVRVKKILTGPKHPCLPC
jgi:hypothetical protein